MDDSASTTGYSGIDRRRRSRDGEQIVIVIDEWLRPTYYQVGDHPFLDMSRVISADRTRLRPEVESVVARLASEVGFDEPVVAALDGHHVLRLTRLAGREEVLYALVLAVNQNRDDIKRAAVRYELTRRQTEVLVLILEGDSAADIAKSLCISEHTVQGYVKVLLSKTKSRNRPAMVAKVLNWNQSRSRENEERPAIEKRGRTA